MEDTENASFMVDKKSQLWINVSAETAAQEATIDKMTISIK